MFKDNKVLFRFGSSDDEVYRGENESTPMIGIRGFLRIDSLVQFYY